MACNLTLGRALPCATEIGGIKALYFTNYNAASGATFNGTDTDQIDGLGTITLYEYELPQNSGQLTSTGNKSEENGTLFFEQQVTVNLPKQEVDFHKELKLMSQTKPTVFVLDNNDNLFCVGLKFGCNVQAVAQTGQGKADLNGYTLTITAQEKTPANFLAATSGPTESNYPFDNVSGTITIVKN